MIQFKKFDWIFQLILIVGIPLFFLINQKSFSDFEFIAGYFIVGGWQLISIITHFFYPPEIKITSRKIHGILTLLTVLITAILIAVDQDALLMFLLGILFWTPALALLYLVTCYLETKALSTPKVSE